MIRGIIFDVDGVIINTENTHFVAFQKVLQNYNYDLTLNKYKQHFSGKSIKGGILSILSETLLPGSENRDNFIDVFTKQKIDITIELFQKQIVYFEDTISFIERVAAGNVSLTNIGSVSDKPILALTTGLKQELLELGLMHHDLKTLFPIVVTADQYTHSKPNPECYLLTLEKMHLKPKEVIGIEDAPAGIQALNNAGIMSVGITNTHSKEELREATHTTETLTELLEK